MSETPALSIPPEIAKGIVSVMRGVKKLAKDGKNEHGRYNFTSVDAFYEAVGPLCADAGIFIAPQEIEREIIPPSQPGKAGTLRIVYRILIGHEGGSLWDAGEREVMVVAAGPQAYASALSFVTKYFERNLFQVPTGDKDDADLQEAAPLPARGGGRVAAPEDKTEAMRSFVKELEDFLSTSPDPQAIVDWKEAHLSKLRYIRGRFAEADKAIAAFDQIDLAASRAVETADIAQRASEGVTHD